MPAQVSQEQFDKIMFLINKGVEEGAKLEVGGKRYGAALLAVPVPPLCVHAKGLAAFQTVPLSSHACNELRQRACWQVGDVCQQG